MTFSEDRQKQIERYKRTGLCGRCGGEPLPTEPLCAWCKIPPFKEMIEHSLVPADPTGRLNPAAFVGLSEEEARTLAKKYGATIFVRRTGAPLPRFIPRKAIIVRLDADGLVSEAALRPT